MTPETTIKILGEIKSGKLPKHGPQTGRHTCEPKTGLTTLTSEPYGPGFGVRSDLWLITIQKSKKKNKTID